MIKEKENEVKVSICVITYNHENYIRECLDSLVSQQTNFLFEIVIRDDKSKDGTYSILKEYANQYPTLIKLLTSDTNLGMNNNLKTVFESSLGDYIALCEGDDFWVSDNKIQLQYDLAVKRSEINFFTHACHSVSEKSTILKQSQKRFFGGEQEVLFDCNDIVSYPGQFAPTSSYFIKSSELKSLPSWFNDAPIGDFFIELYAAKRTGGVYSPAIMSAYRVESIGSWTDTIKKTHPNKKIQYANDMISAIESMKLDFLEYGDIFNDKINSLNFIAALSYLKLDNTEDFREKIMPIGSKYISKYHHLLGLTKSISLVPKLIVIGYELLKKIQWYISKNL